VDYLIAGLGSGAVLAIIGFLLSELGLSQRRSFPRWMPEAGAALMIAALIVWAVTAAAFFSGLDDDASLQVVIGSVVVAALGAVVAAAVMAWSHRAPALPATRQAAVQAVPVVTDEGQAGADETVEAAGETEGVEEAASDRDESDSGIEPEAEPAVEKNWEEIWRQTWGSVAVAQAAVAAEDRAGTGEFGENESGPVDAEVLERWEAPEEAGQDAPGESQEVEAEASLHIDDAGEDEPGFPADEAPVSESDEQPAPAGETNIEDEVPDTAAARRDDAAYPESSLNGSDPETDHDVSPAEADLSGSRTREQM
jgi:hypothetical protein